MARKSVHLTTPVATGNIDTTAKHLNKQEFGKRLYSLMLAKGWNQSQLARYAGLGRDSVSQYVRGRSFPTPQNLQALAKVLSVEPDALLPNYYESAIDREIPEVELKGVHGDPEYMWVRINMKMKRAKALKVLAFIHEEDGK